MNRLLLHKTLRAAGDSSLFLFNRYVRGIFWANKRVHKPMCDFVQKAWENHQKKTHGQTKIRIVVPRTYGKTVCITEGFPPWVTAHNPNLSTLISNEKLDNSNDFLGAIKKETSGKVAGCYFSDCYWDWSDGADAWREEKIEIARKTKGGHNPSILTTSVEIGRTSKHPDIIIVDDPHNPETLSETTLLSVHTHYRSLTQVLSPNGFFIIITTRYDPNDIIGFLDDKECSAGKGETSFPIIHKGQHIATVSQSGQWLTFFMRALETDNDGNEYSTYPELYTTEVLKAERDAHPALFAAQKQNNPLEGEHAPITEKQLDETWVKAKDVPGDCRIWLHCDTAFKESKQILRGDFSAIQESRHADNGNVYYTWAYHARCREEEFCDALVARIQQLRKVGKRIFGITYDKPIGGGGDNLGKLITNICHGAGIHTPVLLPLPREGTRKNRRIRFAAGFWADGRVFVVRTMPHAHTLRRQMLMADRHDDLADAAADAFHDKVYKPQRNYSAKNDGWKVPNQLLPAARSGLSWRAPFNMGATTTSSQPLSTFRWKR